MLLPVRDEEQHVIACLASDSRPASACPTSRCWCSMTGHEIAPARLLETIDDPRLRVLPESRCPTVGWASRGPASSSRTPPPARCWSSSTPTSGWPAQARSHRRAARRARPGVALPSQEVGSLVERLVQPLLQWTWLTFLPLRLAETSPRPSLAAANGQLIAVRRTRVRGAGGHAAVRHEVIEDVALLRAVKRSGGRGTVVDGTAVATCRMYAGGRGPCRRLHQVVVVCLRLACRSGRGHGHADRALRRFRPSPRCGAAGPDWSAIAQGSPGGWSRPGVPAAGSGPTPSCTRCRSWRWPVSRPVRYGPSARAR